MSKNEKETNKVDDVLIPDHIMVEIGEKKYKVEELPRKEYKKLFSVLSKVVEDINKGNVDIDFLNSKNSMDLFTYLSDDVLLEIYHIQLGIPKKTIEKHIKMAQEVALFAAIYQVNRINDVLANFTNLVGIIKWPDKVMNLIQRFRK